MELDVMNRVTGVRKPSEVFRVCQNPRCKKPGLLVFEGEVFCLQCNWDSVDIHAEALAFAQIYRQQARAKSAERPSPAAPSRGPLIQRLFAEDGPDHRPAA